MKVISTRTFLAAVYVAVIVRGRPVIEPTLETVRTFRGRLRQLLPHYFSNGAIRG